ncbi:MAG: helix-turn-helix domain-containing protein [Microbacteriaceae bacterium]
MKSLLIESGLSGVMLARLSGVSRSTQFRVDSGTIDPRVGTLRDLAIAAGRDVRIDLVPLSDPLAAIAARVILDPTFTLPPSKAVSEWVGRLTRLAGEDPIDIVRHAGRCSTLRFRAGATYLSGYVDDSKLRGAGEGSEARWLLSGSSVLSRIGARGLDDAPVVLYAEDSHRLVRLLDNMQHVPTEKARLIVVEYTPDLEVDSWESDGVELVAPIQALIDGFGLGGRLAAAAEQIARTW